MQLFHWWWALALILGVAELVTGTFYLLVLALGCAAGGAAAWIGWGLTPQLVATAVITVAGWSLLHVRQPHRRRRPGVQNDRDVLLDVGERLRIDRWEDDGHALVRYRGASWTAELEPGARATTPAGPGTYEIRGVTGNRLIVAPVAQEAL
jgi:membrane protein implicated in regulation of membrane protease activity